MPLYMYLEYYWFQVLLHFSRAGSTVAVISLVWSTRIVYDARVYISTPQNSRMTSFFYTNRRGSSLTEEV